MCACVDVYLDGINRALPPRSISRPSASCLYIHMRTHVCAMECTHHPRLVPGGICCLRLLSPPNTIPTHVSRMHHARKQLWMRQPMVSVGANEGGREGKTVWREGFYYYTVRGYNRGNAQIIPKAAKQAAVITPRTR